jgi:hypothetical protein|tara:strand:+ start:56 stop:934 length:879 start_codon:yes stop_codon:yes gene_type:complete
MSEPTVFKVASFLRRKLVKEATIAMGLASAKSKYLQERAGYYKGQLREGVMTLLDSCRTVEPEHIPEAIQESFYISMAGASEAGEANYDSAVEHYANGTGPDPTVNSKGGPRTLNQWRGSATRNLRNTQPLLNMFIASLSIEPALTLQWAMPQATSGNLVQGIPKEIQLASMSDREAKFTEIWHDHVLDTAGDNKILMGYDPKATLKLYYRCPKNAEVHVKDGVTTFTLKIDGTDTTLVREQWTLTQLWDYIESIMHLTKYTGEMTEVWKNTLESLMPMKLKTSKPTPKPSE